MITQTITKLFKLEEDEFLGLIVGNINFVEDILEIRDLETESKYELKLHNSSIIKESGIFIHIKYETDHFALSFENENEADKVFEEIKILKNKLIVDSKLNFLNLKKEFQNCDLILKKNLCDKLVDDKILENVIRNNEKENLLVILENMNRRVFFELAKYESEIIQMFYPNHEKSKIEINGPYFGFDEEDDGKIKNECKILNKCKKISLSLRQIYEKILVDILGPIALERYQSYINNQKEAELEEEINNFKQGEKILADEDILEIFKSHKFKGKIKISEEFIQENINVSLEKENVELFYEICIYLKENVFIYLTDDQIKKIFIRIKDYHYHKNDLFPEDEHKMIYLVNVLMLMFSSKTPISKMIFFYKNINNIYSRSGEVFRPTILEYKRFYEIRHPIFYDLLLFMEENHSFMFTEFFVTSKIFVYIVYANTDNKIFTTKLLYQIFLKSNRNTLNHLLGLIKSDKYILEFLRRIFNYKINKKMFQMDNYSDSYEKQKIFEILDED